MIEWREHWTILDIPSRIIKRLNGREYFPPEEFQAYSDFKKIRDSFNKDLMESLHIERELSFNVSYSSQG